MRRLPPLLVLTTIGIGAAAPRPPEPVAVKPFPLSQVRLTPGPFREALDRNGDYLLKLSPDRLLAKFRLQAGLAPKAEAYGGWEQEDLAGHSAGHYLSALSLQYAATGDARFKERARYVVSELALCQQRNPDGMVEALTQFRPKVWRQVSEGSLVEIKRHNLNGAWAPWYAIHKVYAGLRDAWLYTGDAQAKEVFLKLSGWTGTVIGKLDDAAMQRMLDCEFGGMNEVLADAFAITGDQRYLTLARRFDHRAVMDPLRRGEDKLAGLHANTQVPKVIGEARVFELTREPAARAASEFFFSTVLDRYTYANGGNSDKEWFGQPNKLAAAMSGSMTETCNTYNMLKLAMHLFSWEPRASIMDYYERALFNQIYSSIDRKTGMYAYKLGLYGGWFQSFSNPEDSFWCCVGTGMENPPRFGESIYFGKGDTVWVNQFIPSTLDWKEKSATIILKTRYPFDPVTTIEWTSKSPVRATLNLRYPAWAGDGNLIVNGKALPVTADHGSYISIDRRWKTGDVVEWTTPMSLRSEATPDNPNRVAFFYGPVLLAGLLGTDNMPASGPYGKASSDEWKIPPVGSPVLVGMEQPLKNWFTPVEGYPLSFTTRSADAKPVLLAPVWESHHHRFTVYFDAYTTEDWRIRRANAVK